MRPITSSASWMCLSEGLTLLKSPITSTKSFGLMDLVRPDTISVMAADSFSRSRELLGLECSARTCTPSRPKLGVSTFT
eukprot:8919701-Pyramimonas_sp.AAC.4